MRYTPKSELDQRIFRFQKSLRESGIDAAVIVQNADLFYFTGTIQRSHLFIPADGQPLLMVNRSLERAGEESSLDNIVGLSGLKEIINILSSYGYGPFKTLGFELDVLPAAQYLRYKDLFQPAEIVDVSRLIRTVRMIKSPFEIQILIEIAKVHYDICSLIKETLREGLTEVELSGIISGIARAKGHSGCMRVRGFNQELFYIHVLSGDNTSPSYFDGSVGGLGVGPAFAQGSSARIINRDEPVLVDFSFVQDGYLLDQTRIFCLGKPSGRLMEAHNVAMDILHKMEDIAKPGVPCSKLYELAMELAAATPFKDHFLGYPQPVTFVGHGVGLELDELPVIAGGFEIPLEKGMVFALEPKFVFPDGAVGLENSYLVTDEGLENLTIFEESVICL